MSNICTSFVHDQYEQILDKFSREYLEPWACLYFRQVAQKLDMGKILTKFRQTILLLDPNILLTKLGQNVDIFLSKFCQIYKNLGQNDNLQTNLGQLIKILDKILTKIRQNLVKLRLFWQLLDTDKTWTKIG